MILYGFDMIVFGFEKNLFAIFGSFSLIFDIFDPRKLIFIFKGSILLQQEILEARCPTFYRTFNFHFSERLAGISNVRPESRTFGQDSERWRPLFRLFWKIL